MFKTTDDFIEALLKGDLETAERFFLAGSKVNAIYEPDGWTALHYVVENGVLKAAQWLLEHGAEVNARNKFGWTPLHLAIDTEADSAKEQYLEKGEYLLSGEMTKLLLESGADPNARTNNGKTPLAIAKSSGHREAAEELTRYGAVDVC